MMPVGENLQDRAHLTTTMGAPDLQMKPAASHRECLLLTLGWITGFRARKSIWWANTIAPSRSVVFAKAPSVSVARRAISNPLPGRIRQHIGQCSPSRMRDTATRCAKNKPASKGG